MTASGSNPQVPCNVEAKSKFVPSSATKPGRGNNP
jgi:hypothetical protein